MGRSVMRDNGVAAMVDNCRIAGFINAAFGRGALTEFPGTTTGIAKLGFEFIGDRCLVHHAHG